MPESNVINLVCHHTPHTSLVRIKRKPPDVVILSSCEECAEKFIVFCVSRVGEVVKPKLML